MTTAIQLLRSPVFNLRPIPGTLDDGMPMVNTNPGSPGLFFRLEGGGELTKIGPAFVGPLAPNAAPAGYAGNTRGEFWWDTSAPNNPELKIFDGTLWKDVTQPTVHVGLTPPDYPLEGDLWWESGGGILYIYYVDENTEQWVSASVPIPGAVSAIIGINPGDTSLGHFTGGVLPAGATIKAALQALSDKTEAIDSTLALVDLDTNDFADLVGLAENVTDLGTFTGSTIADNQTVKEALQALETSLETKIGTSGLPTAASLHIDDIRSALGLGIGVANFGTFTGSTLSDSSTLPALLQELETAHEAIFTGANVFQGEHTLRDKLSIDPDGNLHLELKRNSVTQCDILLRNPPSGATLNINTVNSHADDSLTFYSTKSWFRAHGGGTGDVQVDGTLTLGSTDVAATLTALQADIDQNESDADAAIALRPLAADGVHTGTTKAEGVLHVGDDGLGSGYYLKIQRNGNTQLDLLARNIPSGGNLNITNSNGNNARVVVYSDEFWCRALGGVNGNGKAKFDGDVTCGSEIKMTNDYADKAAAGAGALGDIAVIGGSLCFHDGTDWKTVTLGAAPS